MEFVDLFCPYVAEKKTKHEIISRFFIDELLKMAHNVSRLVAAAMIYY
jgi:hypothetical protein